MLKKTALNDKTNGNERKIKKYPNDTDRLMLIPEIAEKMQTSQTVISKLIDKKYMEALSFGKVRKVRKVTFEKFLADMEGKDILSLVK